LFAVRGEKTMFKAGCMWGDIVFARRLANTPEREAFLAFAIAWGNNFT
jgi:hypothetical protein